MKFSVALIITLIFIIIGITNIVLWYKELLSIYGLVFGIVFFILAFFTFHFRKKE